MADHFVDSVNGTSTMTGHTMDAPWNTVEYALESGSLTANDFVWVRRNVNEVPVTDIVCAYDGTYSQPIQIIGWPRSSHAIVSSDWTNGNTGVVVDDADMDREKHQGRYVTAPDGRVYLITKVTDASNIVIDREYVGATVTNQTATISADEDYTLAQAIDDSAWVIKKADWNGDADDMPYIDFNNAALQILIESDNCHIFKNMEFKNGNDAYGIIFSGYSGSLFTEFNGCLFYQESDKAIFYIAYSPHILKRCILEGNSTGTSQRGFYGQNSAGYCILIDVAIYNMGDSGLYGVQAIMKNVNIGVEVANDDDDITLAMFDCIGIDVKLGGTNGYVEYSIRDLNTFANFENYQKVLGDHRTYFAGGYFDRVTLTVATTPNKKLSDDAIRITPNSNNHVTNIPVLAHKIFEHRVWADTSSKDYKYWVYNNLAATINDTTATDNLFLKVTYVSGYDDTSEYFYTESISTQIDILDAADDTDWDYLEVTDITPAVASWVILEIYESIYSAAGTIFIDPEVVIV